MSLYKRVLWDDTRKLEAEIERLKKEVEHLRQAYHRVKDENERLSLDLGIKDNPQFGKPY